MIRSIGPTAQTAHSAGIRNTDRELLVKGELRDGDAASVDVQTGDLSWYRP